MGTAPAPGAVFRALAENPRGLKTFECSWPCRAQTDGPRGRVPLRPRAGVVPNFINAPSVNSWAGWRAARDLGSSPARTYFLMTDSGEIISGDPP
jgi:hypothetical protein